MHLSLSNAQISRFLSLIFKFSLLALSIFFKLKHCQGQMHINYSWGCKQVTASLTCISLHVCVTSPERNPWFQMSARHIRLTFQTQLFSSLPSQYSFTMALQFLWTAAETVACVVFENAYNIFPLCLGNCCHPGSLPAQKDLLTGLVYSSSVTGRPCLMDLHLE